MVTISSRGHLCCYNNSSLVLCGAEMSRRKMALVLAFEVNREENVSSQWCLWVHDIIWGRKEYGTYNNLVQELWLDVTRFAAYFRLDKSFVLITYNSLCSRTSTIHLPAPSPFFLVVMEKKGLAICLSLVSYQKGTWFRAGFFFQKSWKLKEVLSCWKKNTGGGI